MKEADVSSNLMTQMHHDCRGAKIIKHNDRVTSDVPDISLSWLGHTNWIEDKVLRKGETLRGILKDRMTQMLSCHELSVNTGGRCWIAVYEEQPKQITIWVPRVLVSMLFPVLVIPAVRGIRPATIDPEIVDDQEHINLANVIRTIGAIRCEGWRHSFVTKLIHDAL